MSDHAMHDGVISSAYPDSLLGRFLRLLAPGFGWCGRCGRPWKFVKHHTTQLTDGHGCFPLCERCWRELASPEARLPYYRTLWQDWTNMADTPWPVMYAAVFDEARRELEEA